jgi:hypothetical protein
MKLLVSYFSRELAGQSYLIVVTRDIAWAEMFLDIYKPSIAPSVNLLSAYGIRGNFDFIGNRDIELSLLFEAFPSLADLNYVASDFFTVLRIHFDDFESLLYSSGLLSRIQFVLRKLARSFYRQMFLNFSPNRPSFYIVNRDNLGELLAELPPKLFYYEMMYFPLPIFSGWKLVWYGLPGEMRILAERVDCDSQWPSSNAVWESVGDGISYYLSVAKDERLLCKKQQHNRLYFRS